MVHKDIYFNPVMQIPLKNKFCPTDKHAYPQSNAHPKCMELDVPQYRC